MKYLALFTLSIMSFISVNSMQRESRPLEASKIPAEIRGEEFTKELQQGTLILNNHTEFPVGYRFETILGNGNIGRAGYFAGNGRKFIAQQQGADPFFALQPGQRIELNTPVRIAANLGGRGSLWGPIISLRLRNNQTNQVKLFQLAKAIEYSIVNNEQNDLKLIDNDGNIIE